MIQGIDISAYQGDVDFDKLATHPFQFAFIRAAVGKVQDYYLSANHAGMKRIGMPFGCYYATKPSGTTTWKAQADYMASIEQAMGGELPPVLDLEQDGGLSKAELENWIAKWIKSFESQTGKTVIIYTSSGFFDYQMPLGDFAWRRLLWLADYTPPYIVPKEWSNHGKSWTFLQDGYIAPGSVYGVQSSKLDHNYYIGGEAEFEAQFGVKPRDIGSVPPPPPSGWVTTVAQLNPRTKPELATGTDAGTIMPGFTFRTTGPDVNGYAPVETWLWRTGLKDG